MGVQLLGSLRKLDADSAAQVQRHPLWIGVVLSGANPYFLLWWATVGLTLTGRAMEFGVMVLILFALVHWLCDLGWLEVLSFAGFKGSAFGRRSPDGHLRDLRGDAVGIRGEVCFRRGSHYDPVLSEDTAGWFRTAPNPNGSAGRGN